MYINNLQAERRDARRARLQQTYMALFFTHLAAVLGAFALFCWFVGQVLK